MRTPVATEPSPLKSWHSHTRLKRSSLSDFTAEGTEGFSMGAMGNPPQILCDLSVLCGEIRGGVETDELVTRTECDR